MRLGIFLLACALAGLVVGCARKAAYSDMNVNASRPNRDTQASAEQPVDAAAPGADPAGGSPAPPPPAATTHSTRPFQATGIPGCAKR